MADRKSAGAFLAKLHLTPGPLRPSPPPFSGEGRSADEALMRSPALYLMVRQPGDSTGLTGDWRYDGRTADGQYHRWTAPGFTLEVRQTYDHRVENQTRISDLLREWWVYDPAADEYVGGKYATSQAAVCAAEGRTIR